MPPCQQIKRGGVLPSKHINGAMPVSSPNQRVPYHIRHFSLVCEASSPHGPNKSRKSVTGRRPLKANSVRSKKANLGNFHSPVSIFLVDCAIQNFESVMNPEFVVTVLKKIPLKVHQKVSIFFVGQEDFVHQFCVGYGIVFLNSTGPPLKILEIFLWVSMPKVPMNMSHLELRGPIWKKLRHNFYLFFPYRFRSVWVGFNLRQKKLFPFSFCMPPIWDRLAKILAKFQ